MSGRRRMRDGGTQRGGREDCVEKHEETAVSADAARIAHLVELAVEIGMELPQISGSDALKGLDLGKMLELVRCGVMGNLVEVESGDGDTVRIFVESL